jgi:4-amino-4-deoxy-L-arabinose transferase-like glycosyltransferase
MTSLAVTERAELPAMARRLLPALGASRAARLVERSHGLLCALLVLLSLGCFLPGFVSLQPMDRDEPRYAQATKQMLEARDFVDIRFQDEARHKKPVGIYWMQSAAVALGEALGVPEARTTVALYRIPSLLGALATVLLTYWAGLAFTTRRGAFAAAVLMGASVLLMVEAHLAKTDAVLAACTTGVMGGLARAFLRRGAGDLSRPTLIVFWAGMAVGILVKGPLVLLFAGTAALLLSWRERSTRWLLALRPKQGLVATLVLVLPWFVAIAVKSGGSFFAASVGQDMLGKVGSGQENHWAPPGFYALAFFGTFWPGAILAAIAVPFCWAKRREDKVAFALAWVLPSWILFEAIPTKLPHYVLPLYPAIAILTAMAILHGAVRPERRGARVSTVLIPAIPAALTATLVFAGLTLDDVVPFTALPVLLAATFLAYAAWRSFGRGRIGRSLALAAVASPLLATGVLGLAQNDLRSLKLSPRLAEVVRGASCEEPQVGSLGYREPSLVFLVETGLELLETGAEAAQFLQSRPCSIVFVERRFEESFRAEAARLHVEPALFTRIAGFNINSGRRLELAAYAVSP